MAAATWMSPVARKAIARIAMPVSHGRAAHVGIARLSSSIGYHPPTHCLREIGITRV